MAEVQDPIKRKRLYDYLAKNQMTDLDYDTFSREYATNPEKTNKLHGWLKANNMTDLDENSFKTEYFGDIKKKSEPKPASPNQELVSESETASLATQESEAPNPEKLSSSASFLLENEFILPNNDGTYRDAGGTTLSDAEVIKMADEIIESRNKNKSKVPIGPTTLEDLQKAELERLQNEPQQNFFPYIEEFNQATSITPEDEQLAREKAEEKLSGTFSENLEIGYKNFANFVTRVATLGVSGRDTKVETYADKKRKKAIDNLLGQGVGFNEISNEQIEEEVKNIAYNDELESVKEQKTIDYVSSLPEEQKQELEYEKINKYQSLTTKEKALLLEFEIDKKKFQELRSYLNNKKATLEKTEQAIEKLQEEGKDVPEDLTNYYKEEVEVFNARRQEIIGMTEKYKTFAQTLQENTDKQIEEEESIDLIKRNYDYVDNMKATFATAYSRSFIEGGYGFLAYKEYVTGNPIGAMELTKKAREQARLTEDVQEGFRKPMEYNEVNSISDLGYFVSQSTVEQVPILMQLAFPVPGVGISATGATSAGSKFAEMAEQSMTGEKDFNPFQMITAPAFEGGFESVLGAAPTYGILKRTLGNTGRRTLFNQGFASGLKQTGKDLGVEITTEMATEVGQNWTNKFILQDKSVNLTDNIDHAGFKTLASMPVFLLGGRAFSALTKQFSPQADIEQLKTNLLKINELKQSLESATSEGAKLTIQKSIIDLEQKNDNIFKKVRDDMSNMDKATYDRVNEITKRQAQLKADAESIKTDGGIPLDQKRALINEMSKEFDALENTRESLVSGEAQLADKLPPDQVIALKDQASRELVAEAGESNITLNDQQITERAIEIYNRNEETAEQAQEQEAQTSTPVINTEAEAQAGEYFTRDIGGDLVVYRRNEDGTASFVPDSEAQNILPQPTIDAEIQTETTPTVEETHIADETTPTTNIETDGGLQPGTVQGEQQGQGTDVQPTVEPETSQTEAVTERKPTEQQEKQNTIVDLKNQYNKLSASKRRGAEGSGIKQRIIFLSSDLGLSVDEKNNKITIKNKEGKSVGKITFKEEIPEPDRKDVDVAISEINKGLLFWDGDPFSPRVDLGISRADIRKGESDLRKGKTNTVPAKRLVQAIKEAVESGEYVFIEGSGKNINRVPIPVSETMNTEQELTAEEQELLNTEREQLAKEYDDWFNSLSEESQNEILEDYENTEQESEATIENVQTREGQEGAVNEEKRDSQQEPGVQEEGDGDVQAQGISVETSNQRDTTLSDAGPVKNKARRQNIFRRFWNNTFMSDQGAPKKLANIVRSLIGERSAYSDMLAYEVGAYNKILNKVKGRTKKSYNESALAINDYLMGNENADVSFLTAQEREQIDYFRERVDSLSDKLVRNLEIALERAEDNGQEATAERITALIETIKGNKGSYLHRTYEAFTNENYLEELTSANPNKAAKDRIQKAVEYIMAENDVTEQEARRQLFEYLDGLKNQGDFVTASANGKAKAPFLKKRQEIPAEIRELLGETKDPIVNYVNTVFKISDYIATLEYQQRLGDYLYETGIGTTEAKEGYTRLVPQSEGWQILSDIFVPTEIKKAIEDLQPLQTINSSFYRNWVKIAAITKLGKTVLSATTTMRNILSGTFLGLNAGFFFASNPKRMVTAFQQAFGTKKTQTELLEERQKMIKMGVVNDGAVSGEILATMNDFSKTPDRMIKKSLLEKGLHVAQMVYKFGDDFYKVIGYYHYKSLYEKNGFTQADAEVKAAERITQTFPTYSRIPRNIQKLRRLPVIGSFPSFAWEVWRTTKNSIEYIGEDIAEKRYGMAARQAAGTAIAYSAAYGLSVFTKSLYGIDDEEDDFIRDGSPEWQRNSLLIYTGKEDGKPTFLDATALFPSETIQKPIRTLFEERQGRNLGKKLTETSKELLDPFLDLDISFNVMLNVLSNKDDSGKEIYQGETLLEGAINTPDKLADYITKKAGPGTYNNIIEFARANDIAPEFFGDRMTAYGREYNNRDAVLAVLGLRFSTINYNSVLMNRGYQEKDKHNYVRSEINRKLKTTNVLSEEKIEGLLKEYQKANKETSEAIIVGIRAARKFGVPEQDIEKALKLSGFAKKDIGNLLFGFEPELKPVAKQTVTRREDLIRLNYSEELKAQEVVENYKQNIDYFNYLIEKANMGIED